MNPTVKKTTDHYQFQDELMIFLFKKSKKCANSFYYKEIDFLEKNFSHIVKFNTEIFPVLVSRQSSSATDTPTVLTGVTRVGVTRSTILTLLRSVITPTAPYRTVSAPPMGPRYLATWIQKTFPRKPFKIIFMLMKNLFNEQSDLNWRLTNLSLVKPSDVNNERSANLQFIL